MLLALGIGLIPSLRASESMYDQLEQWRERQRTGYSAEQKARFLRVGSEKQLFIDELFFETSHNVRLKMNPPRKTHEVSLQADRSWESAIAPNYFNVVEDNGKYRMWYEVYTAEYWYDKSDTLFCYAESEDGIRWTKPNLGLFEWQGATDAAPSRQNNILFRDIGEGANASRVHGTSVFIDPTAGPDQRYKAVSQGMWFDLGKPIHRVALMYSPDGLRWTRYPKPITPLINGKAADGMHTCFWDPSIGKYVMYRLMGLGVENISRCQWRTESADIHNFPPISLVMAPTEKTPKDADFYAMCPIKYPYAAHAYFAFCNLYRHGPRSGPPGSWDDKVEIRLAVSRDGVIWTWPEEGAFIPLGKEGEFDSATGYMGQGIIRKGNELWQYYCGSQLTHQEAELDILLHNPGPQASRVVSRLDGYISVDADDKGGSFTTPPLTFAGSHLTLNFKTNPGGRLRVGLYDERDRPVAGRAVEDCVPLSGDDVAKIVEWNAPGGRENDLAALAGKPVKMKVEMLDSKLYAFTFTPAAGSAENAPATPGKRVL